MREIHVQKTEGRSDKEKEHVIFDIREIKKGRDREREIQRGEDMGYLFDFEPLHVGVIACNSTAMCF